MATNLDLDKQIVEQDRKPTAYFEDIIFQLVQSLKFPPLEVGIIGGTVTADLSLSNQFNFTLSSNIVLDITNVNFAMFRNNAIEIENPGGAFDITAVTVPVGYTAYIPNGSTISTLGMDVITIEIVIPGTDKVLLYPTEMVPA